LLTSSPALSTKEPPVVYSRTVITIQQPPSRDAETDNSEEKPVYLTAQMRPVSTFGDPDLLLSQPIPSGDAYLIPLDASKSYALQFAKVYTPVDILTVDSQGNIRSIYPELIMHNLTQPVPLPKATAAIFYLRGGDAALLNIRPRMRMQHPLFTPPPRVLE
jgi:hypothetical protein